MKQKKKRCIDPQTTLFKSNFPFSSFSLTWAGWLYNALVWCTLNRKWLSENKRKKIYIYVSTYINLDKKKEKNLEEECSGRVHFKVYISDRLNKDKEMLYFNFKSANGDTEYKAVVQSVAKHAAKIKGGKTLK